MQFSQDLFLAGMKAPNKQTQEQELMKLQREFDQKKQMAEYEAKLRDQAIPPDIKGFDIWSGYDPNKQLQYSKYQEARQPFGGDKVALQNASLGIQAANLALSRAKLDNDQRQFEVIPQEKQYNFLRKQGYTHEDALNQAFGVSPKDVLLKKIGGGLSGPPASPGLGMPR